MIMHSRRWVILGTLLTVSPSPGLPLAAQTRIGVAETALDSVRRRIERVEPGHGAPGATVTLRSGNLPAVTPLRIGIGAMRFGFEEVGQVMSTMQGQIEIDVDVPEWATPDVTYFFIVFDFYFSPLALSHAFHVTDSTGRVRRTGALTEDAGAPSCAVMRGDDGETYGLAGKVTPHTKGDRVMVEGIIGPAGCGEELTLHLVGIRPASPPD